MSIKVLYLSQNFYTSPKQISGYATDHWIGEWQYFYQPAASVFLNTKISTK